LKDAEQKQLGWNIRRNPDKINYMIHTDAVKKHLIPVKLTTEQQNIIYAKELERLKKLNDIAIAQMKLLVSNIGLKTVEQEDRIDRR